LTNLVLRPVSEQVCGVLGANGELLGNLKRINGVWKFKALGWDAQGDVIPGGGPLTERHNSTFAVLDAALISATLAPPHTAGPEAN